LARSFVLVIAFALGAIGCAGDTSATGASPSVTDQRFMRVSAYGVSAEVPGDWVATPAADASFATGVSASPGPGTRLVPGDQGLLATRVDATEVGAPSDLYYLAAKGPVIARFRADRRCTVNHEHVYADHAPTAITGHIHSPGDFMASARGTCSRRHLKTRWSYFVVAPGFGPARERGVPGSGLYVIMAATAAAPGSGRVLHQLVRHVRFGQDNVADFVRAVAKTPV